RKEKIGGRLLELTKQTVIERNLRRYLKQKLPEYMLPSRFVIMDHLPLTANGKVDRQALPTPSRVQSISEGSFVTPGAPLEDLYARLSAEVLGLERIGIHDNFFELGGHSLIATQLISRISEVLNIKLPLRSLFEEPTVAGMAQNIQSARQEG